MKQMQQNGKHYNRIQIDDSSSHSTLQLSSYTIPTSSRFPVQTSSKIYNYNTYNVSTAAISFDTTTPAVPSNAFALRQPIRYDTRNIHNVKMVAYTSRSMQQFPWPSHRRQCGDIYDRHGSYENTEFSGNDGYTLNRSLQQPQTSANGPTCTLQINNLKDFTLPGIKLPKYVIC